MYLIKNGNKIKLRVFMKKCKTCGEVLLWKFYYKDNNKIGLSARCKTCTKSKYTYIYIKDNDVNVHRFGICVSKKLGKAHTRNLIKRRVKDIIDKSKLQFKPKDYIIVLKKSASDAEYLDLKEDLISVLKKFDR